MTSTETAAKPTFANTAEAMTYVHAQPELAPGTPGFWKLWGGTVSDIEAGDYVMCKDGGGNVEELYVEATYRPGTAPMRAGIIVDGEKSTIGALCPVVILRWDTKGRLGQNVR